MNTVTKAMMLKALQESGLVYTSTFDGRTEIGLREGVEVTEEIGKAARALNRELRKKAASLVEK